MFLFTREYFVKKQKKQKETKKNKTKLNSILKYVEENFVEILRKYSANLIES